MRGSPEQSTLMPEERAALLLRKYRADFDPFRPYHEARLYALLADGATLLSTTVLRDGVAEPERWTLVIGQGLTGMAAITGAPNLHHDAHRNPRSAYGNPASYQAMGDQVMIAPIKSPNANIPAVGVLFLNRLGPTWWPARTYAAFLNLAEGIARDWFRS